LQIDNKNKMNVPEITQKECGEVDRVTGGAHDRTDLQQLACGPRHLTNFLSGLQQLDAHDYTELLQRIGAHDRTDLQQLACGPRHLTNFLSGLQQLDAHDYTELLYRIERVQRIDGANRNDCLHHPVGSSTIPHPPRAQCHSDSSSNALSDSSDSDAISDSSSNALSDSSDSDAISDSSSNALSDSSDSDAISDSDGLFFDDEGYECSEKWRQWLIERQMGGYCEHDPGPFPTPFSDSDDMESDEDFGEEELRS